MRIFISHSSTDYEKAMKICNQLEADGYSCFIAPRNIRTGFPYAEELMNGLESSDIVLLLLSEKANQSQHVLREIECAVRRNMSIVVYKMEEVTPTKSLEYFLMSHQWVDMKPNVSYDKIAAAMAPFAALMPEKPVNPTILSDPINIDSTAAVPVIEKPDVPKKNSRLILIIVVVAVLFIAAGIALPFVLGKMPSDSGNSDVQSSSDTDSSPSDITDTPDDTSDTDNQLNPDPPSDAVISTAPVISEVVTSSAELGDRITLGTYLGQPIVWRVVKLSDDGKSAVLLSDKILTIKAFDAPEGGSYNKDSEGKTYWSEPVSELSAEQQIALRGNNSWELSNIRTWLNSTKEMVQYSDTAPTAKAMSEHKNGYHTEAGFLNGFTDKELSKIIDTTITTNGKQTTDRVFLLSSDEIEWLYTADVSVYTTPTEQALAQDESNWYDVNMDGYNTKDHYWWLRDNNGATSCEANVVNLSIYDEKITGWSVGLEGFGIRPAITINIAE